MLFLLVYVHVLVMSLSMFINCPNWPCIIYRGSYMSARVLLNLFLRVGEKRSNARLAEHFISFLQRVK